MEQWIRRIEDDPSGLLREKFRYESEQRQRQNTTQNGQKVW
jgi:Ca-activated chloride channel homolog